MTDTTTTSTTNSNNNNNSNNAKGAIAATTKPVLFEYIIFDETLSANSTTSAKTKHQSKIESVIEEIYPNDTDIQFMSKCITNFKELVIYLSLKNRYPNTTDFNTTISTTDSSSLNGKCCKRKEIELNHPILLFVNESFNRGIQAQQQQAQVVSEFNNFSLDSLKIFLNEYFHHLNLIIFTYKTSNSIDIDTVSHQDLIFTENILKTRSKRVLSWIGYYDDDNENGSDQDTTAQQQEPQQKPLISSMMDDLTIAARPKQPNFTKFLLNEINYFDLLELPHERAYYIDMIYEWRFLSHRLSYDELLYCSELMLGIALDNCESCEAALGPVSENKLLAFAFNVRDNYRMGNQFHNFRHAVDVLQATFYLLVKLQCVPGKKGRGSVSTTTSTTSGNDSTNNDLVNKILLPPQITFTLLIASFGHDIGHPGLTNKLLIDHDTPIARHFNKISVLESFHYAEFKSILDKFFPELFTQVENSEEIIKRSILSTDMINHFSYIDKIDDFMKFQQNSSDDPHVVEETRLLLCSLIIKCADISNVSRPLDVSAKWGVMLTNETNEILKLEKSLNMKDAPLKEKNDEELVEEFVHTITDLTNITPTEVVERLPSICHGQCFFIKNFVIMFFDKIQIVLPELKFLYKHIQENVAYWESQHL